MFIWQLQISLEVVYWDLIVGKEEEARQQDEWHHGDTRCIYGPPEYHLGVIKKILLVPLLQPDFRSFKLGEEWGIVLINFHLLQVLCSKWIMLHLCLSPLKITHRSVGVMCMLHSLTLPTLSHEYFCPIKHFGGQKDGTSVLILSIPIIMVISWSFFKFKVPYLHRHIDCALVFWYKLF